VKEQLKILLFFGVFLLSSSLWAFDPHIIQKKYTGLVNKPANRLVIHKAESILIPYDEYTDFLKSKTGIVGKSGNHVLIEKDEVVALPYLIVPHAEYASFMKKQMGIKGKPANHVMIDGKETILLSSKEVQTNLGYYTGIAEKPANYVMISPTQQAVIVEKSQYLDFIKQYPGIMGKPSNYVRIEGQTVIVIPSNEEDYLIPAIEAVKQGALAIDQLKILGNLPAQCPNLILNTTSKP